MKCFASLRAETNRGERRMETTRCLHQSERMDLVTFENDNFVPCWVFPLRFLFNVHYSLSCKKLPCDFVRIKSCSLGYVVRVPISFRTKLMSNLYEDSFGHDVNFYSSSFMETCLTVLIYKVLYNEIKMPYSHLFTIIYGDSKLWSSAV